MEYCFDTEKETPTHPSLPLARCWCHLKEFSCGFLCPHWVFPAFSNSASSFLGSARRSTRWFVPTLPRKGSAPRVPGANSCTPRRDVTHSRVEGMETTTIPLPSGDGSRRHQAGRKELILLHLMVSFPTCSRFFLFQARSVCILVYFKMCWCGSLWCFLMETPLGWAVSILEEELMERKEWIHP